MDKPRILEIVPKPKEPELNMGSKVISGMFMKKLVVIVASKLAEKRRMFPRHLYKYDRFFGENITLLSSEREDEGAHFLETLEEAIKAVDTGNVRNDLPFSSGGSPWYILAPDEQLHLLVISLYAKKRRPETILESFFFDFLPPTEEMRPKTDEEELLGWMAGVHNLLEQLEVCELREPALPPGFHSIITGSYDKDVLYRELPFGFRVKGRGLLQRSMLQDQQKLGEVLTSCHRLVVGKYSHCVPAELALEAPLRAIAGGSGLPGLAALGPPHTSGSASCEKVVRCPCDRNDPTCGHMDTLLIKCNHCQMYQHAACFALLAEDPEILAAHCCEWCARENATLTCSDSNIFEDPSLLLCYRRRALEWCSRPMTLPNRRHVTRSSARTITVRMMMSTFLITYDSAMDIIKQFQEFEILTEKSTMDAGADTVYVANNSRAKEIMLKTFKGAGSKMAVATLPQDRPHPGHARAIENVASDVPVVVPAIEPQDASSGDEFAVSRPKKRKTQPQDAQSRRGRGAGGAKRARR